MDHYLKEFIDRLIAAEGKAKEYEVLLRELKHKTDECEIEGTESEVKYSARTTKRIKGDVPCRFIRDLFGWDVNPEAEKILADYNKRMEDLKNADTVRTDE